MDVYPLDGYSLNGNSYMLQVVRCTEQENINNQVNKLNTHMVLVLDNLTLGSDIKNLINFLPFVIYSSISEVDKLTFKLSLITTYPKYSVKVLKADEIFTHFNQVINNYTPRPKKEAELTHHLELLKVFNNHVNTLDKQNTNISCFIFYYLQLTSINYSIIMENISNIILDKSGTQKNFQVEFNYITQQQDYISIKNSLPDIFFKYNNPEYNYISTIIKGSKSDYNQPTKSINELSNQDLIDYMHSFIFQILHNKCYMMNYNKFRVSKSILDKIFRDNSSMCNREQKTRANNMVHILKSLLPEIRENSIKQSANLKENLEENSKMIRNYAEKTMPIMFDNLNAVCEKSTKTFFDNRLEITSDLEKIKQILSSNKLQEFINNFNIQDGEEFNNSCDFFTSNLTLSNWFDELEEGESLGILIKVSPEPNITIQNITTTLLPITSYVESIQNYFSKMYHRRFGDLNDANIIQCSIIGDSNSIIPLYINKHHWLIAKQYMKPMLGISFSHNPFGYHKKQEMYMFIVLEKYLNMMFDISGEYTNEKFIKLFVTYLRTCAQVCFDNKYNRGIVKYFRTFLDNKLYNSNQPQNTPLLNIIMQCLCTGYVISKKEMKQLILGYIDVNFIENKQTSLLSIISSIKMLVSVYKGNIFAEKFYSLFGGYSRFIKSQEDSFGLLSDEHTLKVVKIIKEIGLIDNSTLSEDYLRSLVN